MDKSVIGYLDQARARGFNQGPCGWFVLVRRSLFMVRFESSIKWPRVMVKGVL